MGRTRLELFGITNETKKKVQIIAKEKNMSTARLLEPVLRKYVEEPNNKRIIYRHGSRQ
jgi:predicted transcriptional regulator